ncbi:DUF4920 domain-containing protein [Christiangramia aquimixticola]|uniref:DUF4920 domain-containing protein n=1 Tax=Christiangramia aquimixticola TaxID=1697558 RepID=UPI003AA8CA89
MHLRAFILLFVVCLLSCKEKQQPVSPMVADAGLQQEEWESFGEKITPLDYLTAADMKKQYAGLNINDTIDVKFIATVNSVCKMKGCWMVLDLPDTSEDPQVKFKDYGFFVPKDIEGSRVIVEGKAFIEEVSVEDQKHYAKDAGKSVEEINSITSSQKTYGFLARGVLLKK